MLNYPFVFLKSIISTLSVLQIAKREKDSLSIDPSDRKTACEMPM